jgi:hypothetical protein
MSEKDRIQRQIRQIVQRGGVTEPRSDDDGDPVTTPLRPSLQSIEHRRREFANRSRTPSRAHERKWKGTSPKRLRDSKL